MEGWPGKYRHDGNKRFKNFIHDNLLMVNVNMERRIYEQSILSKLAE